MLPEAFSPVNILEIIPSLNGYTHVKYVVHLTL